MKPVDWKTEVRIGGTAWPKIVLETLQGAINTQLMRDTDEVVSLYHRRCAISACTLPGLRRCHLNKRQLRAVPRVR